MKRKTLKGHQQEDLKHGMNVRHWHETLNGDTKGKTFKKKTLK